MQSYLNKLLEDWERAGRPGESPVLEELARMPEADRRRAVKEIRKTERWMKLDLTQMNIGQLQKLARRAALYDAAALAAKVELEVARRLLRNTKPTDK